MTSKVKGEHKQCRPTMRAHDTTTSITENKDTNLEKKFKNNDNRRVRQKKKKNGNNKVECEKVDRKGWFNLSKFCKVRLRKLPDIADILWVGCLLIMVFLFDFSHLINCPMVEKTILYISIVIIITSIIFMGICNVDLEKKVNDNGDYVFDEWRRGMITKGSILFFIGAFLFCYSTWKIFSLFSIIFSYVAFMNICGFLNLITFNE